MSVQYAKVIYNRRFGYFNYIYDSCRRMSPESRRQRATLIAALTDRRDSQYRQKLAACGYNGSGWCELAMCPVCVERTQKSLMKAAGELLLSAFAKREPPIVAVKADLSGQRYKGIELLDINLHLLNEQIDRRYLQAGVPLAFSGVQVYLVEDDFTGAEPYWQAGVSSVIVGMPRRDVVHALRTLFPGQSIQRWRDLEPEVALCSTIEPGFFSQITSLIDPSPAAARTYPLSGPELRRVAYCFARYGMPARYVLTGCHVIDGGLELNPGVRDRLKERHTERRRRRHKRRKDI